MNNHVFENTSFLPEKHFFVSSETDIKAIYQPQLASYGIKYVEFLRVFDSGECVILASNSDLLHYVFDNQIPIMAPVSAEYIQNKFNYFILPTGSYKKAIHDVKKYFNLANFVNLVERHQGYIDMFCFGAANNNSDIMNLYLNKMDILENFKHHFYQHSKDLIKKSLTHQIKLSKAMMPSFKGLSAQSADKPLTHRQADCLAFLLKGFTLKQIAHRLSLSPRTVEHYLHVVRSKLNCQNRADLFEKAGKFIK